jgi:hypothetical protein
MKLRLSLLTITGILVNWINQTVIAATDTNSNCLTPTGDFLNTCTTTKLYSCKPEAAPKLEICKYTALCQPCNPRLTTHFNELYFLPHQKITKLHNADGELKPSTTENMLTLAYNLKCTQLKNNEPSFATVTQPQAKLESKSRWLGHLLHLAIMLQA